ncbi:MAG: DNA mismatch repair protein MutS [Myxococcota bacterium]
MKPAEVYEAALGKRREALGALEQGDLNLANLRTVVFGIAVAIAIGIWGFGALSPWWLAAPAVVFLVLVVRHDRLDRERKRAQRAIDYYERALRRLTSDWHGEGITRTDLVDADHPYAADLDLFGMGSLFDLICTARTPAGMHRLAAWLAEAAEPDEIVARQAAVQDLAPRVALREDLALLADGVAADVHPEVLRDWAERAPYFIRPGRARVLAWLVSVCAIAATVAWPLTPLGPVPLIAVALVAGAVARLYRKALAGVVGSIENPQRELFVLAEVLRRLESEAAESERLAHELSRLRGGGDAIAGLIRRVVWLDAMRNQFFFPIGFVTLWPLHFAVAIEKWRAQHGQQIAGWLDALGEVEALASISGFAFENPDFTFPEVSAGQAQYRAEALGHPLLPADAVIKNDVSLGDSPRVLLVSGSNMSGKSTMLRTIGLNGALALSGAPVRARSLALSPISIGASLRTQDSLLGGKSRFYAEIVRLKQVLDLAYGEKPALFLLDEILHGTNSHDRRIGARAILDGFLETDAIGLITTHDLALADAAAELAPRVRNVHFADELVDGELEFDYALRDGIVQRSNAIELMRAVGLRV